MVTYDDEIFLFTQIGLTASSAAGSESASSFSVYVCLSNDIKFTALNVVLALLLAGLLSYLVTMAAFL